MHYLILISINNAEIGKIFSISHHTIIRWIKEHNLSNLIIEPNNDSVIENYLQEVMNICNNLGELYARSILLSKGIKIKHQRLGGILKCLKQSQLVTMSIIRYR